MVLHHGDSGTVGRPHRVVAEDIGKRVTRFSAAPARFTSVCNELSQAFLHQLWQLLRSSVLLLIHVLQLSLVSELLSIVALVDPVQD